MPYLLLAQSEVTARALGAWLELLGEPPLQADESRLHDARCIVVDSLVRNGDQGVGAFESVVNQITKGMAESAPLALTVLVDAVKPSELNPLSDGGTWNSLVAMLILATPEVRWVFGVISIPPSEFEEWHSLSALLTKPWRNPLMDPTGLRNHVKRVANSKRALGIPDRRQRAAAIDEEAHYATFHAYTAYRFGYRADTVTSWDLMRRLFSGGSENHGFQLLFEDVNLYFSDRPEEKHISTFGVFSKEGHDQGRAHHCAKLGYETVGLETSDFRIIVTSGHSGASPSKMVSNQKYVKDHKKDGWGYVLKPTSGMFDLWNKARLFERLQPGLCAIPDIHRQGLAPSFLWPPEKEESSQSGSGAHSAPGKLMLIASHLVRRADTLRPDANTVEECIRGAVLATEALELLGYRTPTLALQALELKQWFETKAEVAFGGVGHHFEVERRFEEIERETKVAGRFHDSKSRNASALNAAVGIANQLVLVFRDAGQFEEEEECLRKLRWWNRKLSFMTARSYWHWPGLAFLAYAEWLISSLGWLLLSVAAWLLVVIVVWAAFSTNQWDWKCAIEGTMESFIGSGVETGQGKWVLLLSGISAMLGFFHLGVFVSFLYSAIARK